MDKLKFYKILRIILIITTIIVAFFVIRKFYRGYKAEKRAQEVLANIKADLEKQDTSIEEIDATLGEYKVIGIIKIPKIDLEYPILEKTNFESLNISVTKFWGNEINEIGNVTIAGHNTLAGAMFGKIKRLTEGDIIELTDKQNITLKYKVFETSVIDPNDISIILPVEEGTREVTLITCENGQTNRRIVKAREVK